MTTAAAPATRNLTIIVLCSLLVFLFPLSVTAQEESDLPTAEDVMFVNPETGDALFISIEPWESQNEVDFAMRLYENDNIVEGHFGEGYEVLSSDPLSEEDAMEWSIEGGLEFELELDGDPVTLYVLPIELDVVIVMYLGEGLSERRLNRFVGDVTEDGVDVRTPRGFERIDDLDEFFD